jgi:hypothetical protein
MKPPARIGERKMAKKPVWVGVPQAFTNQFEPDVSLDEVAERGATRPPHLPLDAAEKAEIKGLMRDAMARRPELPDLGPSRAA